MAYPQGKSLSFADCALRVKASNACVRLLRRIGVASTLYVEAFGSYGAATLSVDAMSTLHSVMMDGLSPACIRTSVREVHRFIDWAATVVNNINDIGVLTLGGYFRMVRGFGKFVPSLVLAASTWAEKVSQVRIGAACLSVRSFVARLSKVDLDGSPCAAPAQAPMVPPDVIVLLGQFVCDSSREDVLRIFAGVALLCCHGIKRWSGVFQPYWGGHRFGGGSGALSLCGAGLESRPVVVHGRLAFGISWAEGRASEEPGLHVSSCHR